MIAKRKRTVEELEQDFNEQLKFIELSAASYDGGFVGEAKRLATRIRVLVHDTVASYSLLSQMNRKDILFLDTAFDKSPKNLISYGGLVAMAKSVSGGETKYIALLDELPPPFRNKWISFENWWAKPIFADQLGKEFTRKDIILTACNQEGGAHIDPKIDILYDSLVTGEFMGWQSHESNNKSFISNTESAAIRQITHEVLKTLKSGYSKKPELQDLVIYANPSINI
jgi:hypothetical protein